MDILQAAIKINGFIIAMHISVMVTGMDSSGL